MGEAILARATGGGGGEPQYLLSPACGYGSNNYAQLNPGESRTETRTINTWVDVGLSTYSNFGSKKIDWAIVTFGYPSGTYYNDGYMQSYGVKLYPNEPLTVTTSGLTAEYFNDVEATYTLYSDGTFWKIDMTYYNPTSSYKQVYTWYTFAMFGTFD